VGLSEDQKAMLRLLAQREQGYDDIAALMGISVEQVRERVKDALDQLKDEGDSAEELPSAEPPAQPAPPPPPPPKEPSPQAAPAAKDQSPAKPKISLPESQGARAAVAAGVAALVLLVVVLIVGGGDDSGDSSPTAASTPATEGEPTSGNVKQVTKAVLEPVGGSGASGVAVFGRVKNSLALQVEAEGLTPTAKGTSYTVWLSESPQKMLPLASSAVGKDGRIGTQFEVPTEVLAYLANETFDQIAITETDESTLKASLNKATGEKKAPEYTGTEVLRGTITGPIIGAAKKTGN
jgi:Sigma-70, region 4